MMRTAGARNRLDGYDEDLERKARLTVWEGSQGRMRSRIGLWDGPLVECEARLLRGASDRPPAR